MSNGTSYMKYGLPEALQPDNTFDFVFSNPFQHESEYTPASRTVPRIPESRPIFVDDATDRSLTFAQLKKDSSLIAHQLLHLETTHPLDPNSLIPVRPTPTCPGNPHLAPVVLIQLPNCLALPPLFLGVLAAHLSTTLVSPLFTAKEIAWVLEHARPSLVITATACLPAMRDALAEQKDRDWFEGVRVLTVDAQNDAYPSLAEDSQQSPSDSDWKMLLKDCEATSGLSPPLKAPVKPYHPKERCAVILWSSGTSGMSKGVLLSHHTLNFCATSIWHDADFYRRGEQQRWLGFVPFFHIFGISNILLPAIAAGATVYLQARFSPPTFLEAVKRRKITYLVTAPPGVAFLAKSPALEPYLHRDSDGKHAFSSMTGGVSGGAPLGFDTISQVYERIGFRVRRGYGLTEASGGVTMQKELGMDKLYDTDGDLGTPHWGVEVMIADAGATSTSASTGTAPAITAKPVTIGLTGEILVRSPGLLMSYLSHPSAPPSSPEQDPTLQSLTSDGWFRTGDIGRITANSRLIYTDRIKEIIKVKAYQVAPAELEAILTSDPAVADAGVVAIWDERGQTEWPKAYVSLTEAGKGEYRGASDGSRGEEGSKGVTILASRLKRLVEEQTAVYKWLKGGIVFTEAIPRSPSGKILRRVLKGGVKGRTVDLYDRRMERL